MAAVVSPLASWPISARTSGFRCRSGCGAPDYCSAPPPVRQLVADGVLPPGSLLDGLTAIRNSRAGLLTLVLEHLADSTGRVAGDAPVRTLHVIARRHPGLRSTVAVLLARIIMGEPVEHQQRLAACRLLRDLAPASCLDVLRTLLDAVRSSFWDVFQPRRPANGERFQAGHRDDASARVSVTGLRSRVGSSVRRRRATPSS
ncbi:hypothetical protein [Micromonospora sp. NPDC048830]|uniref:hypothetical protein n=1 Tax=Micromonospora sp. NPDC048830 TaxID=3364257 RepID=UPI003712856E